MHSHPFYVVDFDPFAIRFPEGFFLEGIRWYGLAYLAGFIIGILLLNLYTAKKRNPLSKDDNISLITYLLFGVIIGGRLGYMLFYDFGNFVQNPLIFFQVWKGGMASHGGFLGVIIAMLLFARVKKVSFWKISDMVVTICCPGIFLGRLANFINGELWGKISAAPWAMIFPHSAPEGTPIYEIAARHPSQLYEALFEGLLLFIYIQWRFWRGKAPKGQIAGEFLVVYGLVRIFCELFREPDFGVSLILGMSRGTFYSLISIVIGLCVIIYAKYGRRKNA